MEYVRSNLAPNANIRNMQGTNLLGKVRDYNLFLDENNQRVRNEELHPFNLNLMKAKTDNLNAGTNQTNTMTKGLAYNLSRTQEADRRYDNATGSMYNLDSMFNSTQKDRLLNQGARLQNEQQWYQNRGAQRTNDYFNSHPDEFNTLMKKALYSDGLAKTLSSTGATSLEDITKHLFSQRPAQSSPGEFNVNLHNYGQGRAPNQSSLAYAYNSMQPNSNLPSIGAINNYTSSRRYLPQDRSSGNEVYEYLKQGGLDDDMAKKFAIMSMYESNGQGGARSPLSSAKGVFQIIDPTWEGLNRLSGGQLDQEKYLQRDPEQLALIANIMSRDGLDTTSAAHLMMNNMLGNPRYQRLMNSKPYEKISDILPNEVIRNNPILQGANLTAREVLARFEIEADNISKNVFGEELNQPMTWRAQDENKSFMNALQQPSYLRDLSLANEANNELKNEHGFLDVTKYNDLLKPDDYYIIEYYDRDIKRVVPAVMTKRDYEDRKALNMDRPDEVLGGVSKKDLELNELTGGTAFGNSDNVLTRVATEGISNGISEIRLVNSRLRPQKLLDVDRKKVGSNTYERNLKNTLRRTTLNRAKMEALAKNDDMYVLTGKDGRTLSQHLTPVDKEIWNLATTYYPDDEISRRSYFYEASYENDWRNSVNKTLGGSDSKVAPKLEEFDKALAGLSTDPKSQANTFFTYQALKRVLSPELVKDAVDKNLMEHILNFALDSMSNPHTKAEDWLHKINKENHSLGAKLKPVLKDITQQAEGFADIAKRYPELLNPALLASSQNGLPIFNADGSRNINYKNTHRIPAKMYEDVMTNYRMQEEIKENDEIMRGLARQLMDRNAMNYLYDTKFLSVAPLVRDQELKSIDPMMAKTLKPNLQKIFSKLGFTPVDKKLFGLDPWDRTYGYFRDYPKYSELSDNVKEAYFPTADSYYAGLKIAYDL